MPLAGRRHGQVSACRDVQKPAAAAAALGFLEARPWPASDTEYRKPAHDEATAAMRGWYQGFLARAVHPAGERSLPG
jgi:hypothetical protein